MNTMRNMLSRAKAQDRRNQSPFSSPYSNLLSSPINAQRSSAEERRRPAAKFNLKISPGPLREAEIASDEDGEPEEDHGELSPLLPIFSAEHLGLFHLGSVQQLKIGSDHRVQTRCRFTILLTPYAS